MEREGQVLAVDADEHRAQSRDGGRDGGHLGVRQLFGTRLEVESGRGSHGSGLKVRRCIQMKRAKFPD